MKYTNQFRLLDRLYLGKKPVNFENLWLIGDVQIYKINNLYIEFFLTRAI